MNEESDDWEDDGTAVETACSQCGEVKLCRLVDDPFIAEIYPEDLAEHKKEYYCGSCFRSRADES